MQAKTIRIVIIATAVLSLCLTVFALFEFRRAAANDAQTRSMRRQIVAIQDRIEASKGQTLPREATALASQGEESAFIASLKTMAKDSGVVIAKWTVVTQPKVVNPEQADKKKPAKEKELMAGVTPVAGNLEVQGSYRGILMFTNRLLTAPRLYNLGFVTMSRDDNMKQTHLGMVVTRYVETETPVIQEGQKV